MDLPTFCVNIIHDLRKLFPGHCQHLDQKRRRIDAVFSVDVPVYGQTAGRLAPMMAPVSCILAETYLKPTGTS